MPKGKGTYGTKVGRPPKKKITATSVHPSGRMSSSHGTGTWYRRLLMTVTYVYRGVEYTRTTK